MTAPLMHSNVALFSLLNLSKGDRRNRQRERWRGRKRSRIGKHNNDKNLEKNDEKNCIGFNAKFH